MVAILIAFLFLSVAALFFTILRVVFSLKKHDLTEQYETLYIGTIISSVCYFFPFYCDYFSTVSTASLVKSFFLSIHHSIRLFLVGASYDELRIFASAFGLLGSFYAAFGIILFLLAPALTVTVVISCLQRVFISLRIGLSPKKDYYIFSEVNLQSTYLAQDIRKQYPRANIIFLGVDKEKKSEYEKIKNSMQHIYPTLLSTDCIQMNRLMVRYRKNAKFFIIGEDNEVNAAQAISILDDTPSRSTREIYVRLSQDDHLLDDLPAYKNTHVFRIEHINSLVVHNLEKIGTRIFEGAKQDASGKKVLSILVVGLGRTGSALVRNLSWFTQIEGYTTIIHAFEQDKLAIERFKHSCPGFFDGSGIHENFQIIIHPDMVLGTPAFVNELSSLRDVGFVFVAFGSDRLNVNAALDIRKVFARFDVYPPIQAVLRNDDTGRLLSNSKTVRGEFYNIEFIGSYKTIYSLDFITDAKNKEEIIRNASRWLNKDQVDEEISHEESYRMHKAEILHRKLMNDLNIAGEQRDRSIHRRWVNQLLSEGYLYGAKRTVLGKLHPLLVPYDQLPEKYRKFE